MATRTISTRLVIDGEAEFKRAVTSINTELRKMSSELKLAEAQFAEQANTTEALKAKLKALQNVYDAQKKKTEELNEKFKAVQESKQTLAETMAEAEIDFRNKCNEIVADAETMVNGLDLSAVAAQAGTNTGQAYISALMDALGTYISTSMPDVEYPTRSTNASGAVVSSDRRTKSNTYNTTINVTSPTRLSPSEIARAEKKALRLVAQNER